MNIKTLKTESGMDKICISLPLDINYGGHTEPITFYADVPKGGTEEVLARVEEYFKDITKPDLGEALVVDERKTTVRDTNGGCSILTIFNKSDIPAYTIEVTDLDGKLLGIDLCVEPQSRREFFLEGIQDKTITISYIMNGKKYVTEPIKVIFNRLLGTKI